MNYSVSASQRRPKNLFLILVLALLTMFPPLSIDMYLPAFHQIELYLQAPKGSMELSLSLFFLGLAIGQLVFGPVIDRWGRRTPLLIGVAVFCIASLLILLTDNLYLFMGLRLIQALGACAGMVVGRAIVADLFKGEEAAKTMNLLIMIMTLAPITAPFVGSAIVSALNWKWVFILLLLIGLIAFVLTLRIVPETHAGSQRSQTSLGGVFRQYYTLLFTRSFLLPALVAVLIQSALFSFITASSRLFMGHFELSATQYGLTFGLISVSMVFGARLNAHMLSRYSVTKMIDIWLPVFVIFSGLLLIVASTSHLWVLLIPLWITIGLVSLLSANGISLAMQASTGKFGLGSALIGSMQFGIAFLFSSIIGAFPSDNATTLALAMLLSGLLATGLWIGKHWFEQHQAATLKACI